MLRSLFSGVSGLKNEQSQMDVISNNISNLNTTGFKRGRITFADTLSETLSGARGTAGNFGGANPIQIGRGARISSIDTDFKQGSLDSTGISTDLAINGKGFFIVTDGQSRYYSRAGAFQMQKDGSLMAQGGSHYVMGRLADTDGNIQSTTSLDKIVLPFGRKEPAKATSNVDFYCNLDRNASTTEEWISQKAMTVDDDPATLSSDLREIDGNEMFAGDTIDISGTDKDGNDVSGSFVYGIDGLTVGDLIDKINAVYSSNDAVNGATASIDQNGNLRVKANQAGNNDLTVFLSKPSSNHEATTESHSATAAYTAGGTTPATPATLYDKLSSLDGVSGVTVGNSFTISGTNPDGTTVNDTFTIQTGNETIKDLLDEINSKFTGLNASLDSDGKIQILDTISGESATAITISDGSGTTAVAGIARNFTSEVFSSNTTLTTGGGASTAVGTDNLTDIDNYNYANGDTIVITSTRTDGTTIRSELIVGTDVTTVDDLLSALNSTFPGTTATLSSGQIIVSDNSGTDSNQYTSMIIADKDTSAGTPSISFDTTSGTNSSSIVTPGFKIETEGSAGTHETSIDIFDSMGQRHKMAVKYTQDLDKNANRWTWEVTIDNGTITPSHGSRGYVEFNDDGSLKQFASNDNSNLIFDVPGAQKMDVDLSKGAGTPGSFDGFTQLASPSTNLAIDQDGYTLGVLDTINIDDQGRIFGIYSNGVNKALAQIALASFTNDAGLQKEGNSLYSANDSSGNPVVSWAGQNSKTVLKSGYLESSNVDLTDEFAKMIISQRSLQANAKVVNTADQILSTIIDRMKR